jgi:hypothetical protein
MSIITITGFTGEQPRIINRLLPPHAANDAIELRMDDGGLAPFAVPKAEHTFPGTPNYQTVYRHGPDWLGWTSQAWAVPGPVDADRLYVTQVGQVPKMIVGGTTYDLAVPAPVTAPTLTPSGAGAGEVTVRNYVYTYVTAFGEESEPSPISLPINWQAGITVTLSTISAPPGGRNITLQRFYRTQTGSAGTDLYFVAERAASAANFVDNIPVTQFAERLPSRTWNGPPAGLIGLTAMPNGIMAGFVGKKLYFCEPYLPHAWPEVYAQTVDAPIVGLGAMDVQLVVITEGQPWRAAGTTPSSMSMSKVETNLPGIADFGIVDLGYAIAWAAPDGLAIAKSSGEVGLVSDNLFNPRDWRALNPAGIRAGQYHGRFIGSFDGVDPITDNPKSGSIIIDPSGEVAYLIRTATLARSWYFDTPSGDLFYLATDGKNVYRFDPEQGAPALYYWRSKDYYMPIDDNFGCILVESGEGFSELEVTAKQSAIDALIAANQAMIVAGTATGAINSYSINGDSIGGDNLLAIPAPAGGTFSLGVYCNDVRVATIGRRDRVQRLPGGFLGRKWALDVYADVPIDKITMARTVDEIKQAQAA